jgi:hypothetical protein
MNGSSFRWVACGFVTWGPRIKGRLLQLLCRTDVLRRTENVLAMARSEEYPRIIEIPFSSSRKARIKRGDLMRFFLITIWVCLKIVYPYTQWLMIIIPTKWL